MFDTQGLQQQLMQFLQQLGISLPQGFQWPQMPGNFLQQPQTPQIGGELPPAPPAPAPMPTPQGGNYGFLHGMRGGGGGPGRSGNDLGHGFWDGMRDYARQPQAPAAPTTPTTPTAPPAGVPDATASPGTKPPPNPALRGYRPRPPGNPMMNSRM